MDQKVWECYILVRRQPGLFCFPWADQPQWILLQALWYICSHFTTATEKNKNLPFLFQEKNVTTTMLEWMFSTNHESHLVFPTDPELGELSDTCSKLEAQHQTQWMVTNLSGLSQYIWISFAYGLFQLILLSLWMAVLVQCCWTAFFFFNTFVYD